MSRRARPWDPDRGRAWHIVVAPRDDGIDNGVAAPRARRRALEGCLPVGIGGRPPVGPPEQDPTPAGMVLGACSSTPATVAELAAATGLGVREVVLALRDLNREGEVRKDIRGRFVGYAPCTVENQYPRTHERGD